MSSSTNNSKVVKLRSSEGEIFDVDEAVALRFETIKKLLEECDANDVIPVPEVKGKTLSKIMEWCKKHTVGGEATEEEALNTWDAEFFKDETILVDLILAANYLNIKDLLDQSTTVIAEKIKDFAPEQVRKLFNIENDFTPEEEAKIRQEYSWTFL